MYNSLSIPRALHSMCLLRCKGRLLGCPGRLLLGWSKDGALQMHCGFGTFPCFFTGEHWVEIPDLLWRLTQIWGRDSAIVGRKITVIIVGLIAGLQRLISGGRNGLLPSGHTCVEQSNNCNDGAHSERGQQPFRATEDAGMPQKGWKLGTWSPNKVQGLRRLRRLVTPHLVQREPVLQPDDHNSPRPLWSNTWLDEQIEIADNFLNKPMGSLF